MLIGKFNSLIEASNGQGQRRAALSVDGHLHAAYTYHAMEDVSLAGLPHD